MTSATTAGGLRWRSVGPAKLVFGARAVALAAGVATALLTARILGPEGRGHVAAFAILQLLGSVVTGLGTGAAAYVLASRAGTEPQTVERIGGAVVQWTLVVLMAVAALVAAMTPLGMSEQWLGTSSPAVLGLVAAGAAGQYATMAFIQLATGLGRPWPVAVGFAVAPVLVAVGSVVVAVAGASAVAFMVAHALGWCGAAALLVAVVGVRPRSDRSSLVALVRTGRAAAIGDMANALLYRLDTLILGLIAGAGAVGVYALAVQVLEPLWIVATAGTSGLLIRLRTLDDGARRAVTMRSAAIVGVITAAGVAVMLVMMPILIGLVGPGFEPSWTAALLLGPGIVCLAVSKILAAYHTAAARLWLGSVVATTCFAVTTALDLALIPTLTANGASIAASVGYGVSVVLWLVAFRRYTTSAALVGAAPPAR